MVWCRLGTFSATYCHEAHTTSSLANMKAATSISGVARNLYSSCGSEIIFVRVLSSRSVSLPRKEFRHSFARLRLAGLSPIASLSNWTPSVEANSLIYLSSSAGLGTQFGYSLASAFSFRKVSIYWTKRPPVPVCGSYCHSILIHRAPPQVRILSARPVVSRQLPKFQLTPFRQPFRACSPRFDSVP